MRSTIWEILGTILIALVIFGLVQLTLEGREIQYRCMEPNLKEDQHILINKAAYFFHSPQRGDVIIFRYPRDREQIYVKRIIAIPGDTIEIKDGIVYINGSPCEEPYVSSDTEGGLPKQTIPPDRYFVMGDNRNGSWDSRYWGTVPRGDIIGKTWLCYWPPGEWGLAPNYSWSSE